MKDKIIGYGLLTASIAVLSFMSGMVFERNFSNDATIIPQPAWYVTYVKEE